MYDKTSPELKFDAILTRAVVIVPDPVIDIEGSTKMAGALFAIEVFDTFPDMTN